MQAIAYLIKSGFHVSVATAANEGFGLQVSSSHQTQSPALV